MPVLYDEMSSFQSPASTAGPIRAKVEVQIRPSRSDFPRSQSVNWASPVPATSERDALQSIQAEWEKQDMESPDYDGYTAGRAVLIADLYDFEIYRSPQAGHEARRWEMTSLHHLEVPTTKKLSVDGFLCLGNVKHYVQGIEIKGSSIEGYGDDEHGDVESPLITAYIQSELASTNARYDVWFRLNMPSPKYKRFHDPFLWVAQFGKHVIDFIEKQPPRSVGLESFRELFLQDLLRRKSSQHPAFKRWHHDFKRQTDFRVAVHAYKEYIHCQAYNLPASKTLLAHPLWADCMVRGLTTVQEQEQIVGKTLATPYVNALFQHMYFGGVIKAVSPSPSVRFEQERRKRRLGFEFESESLRLPSRLSAQSLGATPVCQPYGHSPVQVGDIVAFDPDKEDQSLWINANWEWLAYVQGVQPHGNLKGLQRLSVLYLYRPRETNIFKASYPYDNELFFSDNCNCGECILLSNDINGRYDVEFAPSTIPMDGFFIRQTYITQESFFRTFQSKHKICVCRTLAEKSLMDDSQRGPDPQRGPMDDRHHQRGDAVYVMTIFRGRKILEPVIVKEWHKAGVTVRRLARLGRDFSALAKEAGRANVIAANELVLTDNYDTVPESKIQRRCNIRFVRRGEEVPFPYNRGGAGDFWFMSMGVSIKGGISRLVFLAKPPTTLNEGPRPYDLTLPGPKKLPGLSIFSGGGNLDRGVEEGGAVDLQWAVDLSAEAIHTQRANARNPGKLQLFFGSVDDYLDAALSWKEKEKDKNKEHQLIAKIGQVSFIAAGSPCPGFSLLQQNPFSAQSLRNASHISTFCSFVDLYRPEYAILENVVSMSSTRTGFEEQNVLSQVVACLVSMGYQVNQFLMDAWCYGSAQQRSRLFITIAAPGLEPIVQPWHTHSLLKGDTAARSLGKLPNGQRFGEREHYPTPFTFVSAKDATDLPDIGNSAVQTCVSHPDHRVSVPPVPKDRALLQYIPKHPPGSGYKQAFELGLIPPLLQKVRASKDIGKSYQRVKETGLIPTITTQLSIRDARNGATVHWAQDRPITIQEARRAQGYPDEEPIIGNLAEQYKIVGNGVDRKVSFALGLALRQAVQQNPTRSSSSRGLVSVLVSPKNVRNHSRHSQSKTPGSASIGNTPTTKNPARETVRSVHSTVLVRQPSQKEEALLNGTTPPVKRRREESMEQSNGSRRARADGIDGETIRVDRPVESDVRELQKKRKTRHSGLQVEFQPNQWSRQPEREYSAVDQRGSTASD